jgi:predicted GH43/DUF377 family glycosyl hydrolase
MPNVAVENDFDGVQAALNAPPERRQSIRVAYIPLAPALQNLAAVLNVAESYLLLAPTLPWGHYKVGGGTAPIRTSHGWLEIFHGVDQLPSAEGKYRSCYSGGLLFHDLADLRKLLYVSPAPLFKPETREELEGTVNNVVFPTGIVARPDLGEDVFDIYYGMADRLIGRCRLTITFKD